MSRWFPGTATEEGIQAAANGGCYAGIGFGFLALLGMGLWGLDAWHRDVAGPAILLAMLGPAIEAAVAFVAAYRFRRRKGLVIGSIATILFALEVIARLMSGHLSGGFLQVLIALGLVNGLRAAWAARRLGSISEAQLKGIFE